MCGIAGVYGIGDRRLIARMTNTITHRGPDSAGYYVDDNISLGHRRLSIIDLSTGDQPIYNEDKSIVIVYNGECYNYKRLREICEWAGHKFYTESDTEVLVHLYETLGDTFAKELNGIFAFAIYDSDKKKLLLSRDRMGVKPLFYAQVEDKLIFASEVKAILQYPELKREMDHDALSSFLTFGSILGDKTMFKGIKKLLPGHYLTFKSGKITIGKYHFDEQLPLEYNEDKLAVELRAKLELSVKSQMMSDVPIGALLSGGIDSSTVVGLMSKETDLPIQTFTVGFGREDDELKYAKVISEHYNTDHHEITITPKDVPGIAAKLAWHYDDPIWDAASVPTYFVSELAKKHVTVVLTGEGADELFAGYNRYKPFSSVFPLVHQAARVFMYNKFAKLFDASVRKDVMHTNTSYADKMEKDYLIKGRPVLESILRFEQEELLPNQLLNKVDRATMANSLEARVPFLDNTIVDLSRCVPIELKMNGLVGKYILRKAVKDLIPEAIIKRPKQGFGASARQWLGDKEVHDYIDGVLDTAHIMKEGLDYGIIKKLSKDGGLRKGRSAYNVWSCFVLELFYRTYFESDGAKVIEV